MKLADEQHRRRVLTDLDATLLVEAAAGTGKTSLIAGRIAMLLASGCPPQHIAAITFTELAAGELALRIRSYVATLLAGEIPTVLTLALPHGLSAEQTANLVSAQQHLDEITTSTIHGFCQEMIRSYAIETGLDPGSRVIDGPSADAMFESVFSAWLIDRLSSRVHINDPVAVLSQHDPLEVVELVKKLADLKRTHPAAGTTPARLDHRTDIDFVEVINGFARWFATKPGEPRTARLLDDLQTIASFYADCFRVEPSFRDLWRLAHPPRLDAMESGSSNLAPYRCKTSWKNRCGANDGERFNSEAEEHVANIDRIYRDLLGQIADGLVGALSSALDDVISAYALRKREAAALDFDDLLLRAHDLVSEHEPVRVALGDRYRHIFVDEFQDTDRIQAAIIFLIAAESRPARWQDARLRSGSLFLVGDPKQAIYRFRGADIDTYNEARAAIASQASNSVVEVTANFRSQQAIIDHVNKYFEPVLQADGQPGYVPLSATLEGPEHGLPCAATVTIELPHDPSAAVQRDEEAAIVAKLCRRLIGAIRVKRVDGSVTVLTPGDIALLAPTGTELWRYERALEAAGLSVASQAGKTLLRQQETQDVLALLRILADPADTLAFGAFMRGPMVGVTDEELLDIAEALHGAFSAEEPHRVFDVRTPLELVSNPVAKSALRTLQHLRRRAGATTPRMLLSEAIEQLHLRVVVAARHGNRSARALANLDALIEMARPYDVSGLRAFVRDLQSDWELRIPRSEGRIDASTDAVEIVTIHSSKGLEWPVVIPINTSTTFRPSPQFVHRQSDNTLHWVIGGVEPPALAAARAEESRQESLQRERMWYVACTRARDLLVIPELPVASSQSWSKILDLGHHSLPRLSLDSLPEPVPVKPAVVVNDQTPERFASEAETIANAAPSLTWRRPSDYDRDRAEALEPMARAVDDAFEFVQPVGAGRLRGVLLHKLMEEFLTGELADDEPAAVERRAKQLLDEVLGAEAEQGGPVPDPTEMARTALKTLTFADVAALRPHLIPEIAVWSKAPDCTFLAGRADALAVEDGNVIAVLDWKSDVAPSQEERSGY
ncbi:MAG: UvrD-helicase domain-containing protein, partial [Phycisphaerales bacterium]|nr:UvrD-helicase domain-containing protein [Phycisphaerales bacterium]